MASPKYLVNLIQYNVGLLEGKYLIPVSGWLEVPAEVTAAEEVQEAVRKGWLEVKTKVPTKVTASKAEKIVFSQLPVHGSKTIPGKSKVKEAA